MYDYVHGYGSNVTGNGYVETDGNRNSLFNTEAPRNDAMIFGEYEPGAIAAGDDFYGLSQFGHAPVELSALQPDEQRCSAARPCPAWTAGITLPPGGNCDGNGNFSPAQAVNLPQTQDRRHLLPGQ